MTDRLVEITARIDGIRQLGAVVNAMRGIAAVRAQQARGQLTAVDSYANILKAAIGRVLSLDGDGRDIPPRGRARRALVVFGAEQGFAGAYSQRVLDEIAGESDGALIFFVGSRGRAIALERGVAADWYTAQPQQSGNAPRVANQIAEALYSRIASGEITELEAVFQRWLPGTAGEVVRDRLFPLDASVFKTAVQAPPPLTYLAPELLLDQLTADYIHSRLCHATLHAFAAENEARMQAMAAARSQIDRQLSELQARQRQVRQEEITSEIIELAAGEMASRAAERTASQER
ncbi:MAG: F0F1 ATP synthase subunit gamma [Hyphomicrobiaceae bacterium]|nr:F0F1 ATP synthase subunit gamma [Hyphomicrobiaceae bacterium]